MLMVFFVFTWSQKFWAKNNVLASKQSRSSLFQTSFQLSGLIFSRDHLLGKVIFRALSCLFRLSCHFLIRLKKTHTHKFMQRNQLTVDACNQLRLVIYQESRLAQIPLLELEGNLGLYLKALQNQYYVHSITFYVDFV